MVNNGGIFCSWLHQSSSSNWSLLVYVFHSSHNILQLNVCSGGGDGGGGGGDRGGEGGGEADGGGDGGGVPWCLVTTFCSDTP